MLYRLIAKRSHTHVEENKKIYIETYGCQMNFSDSEIVASILSEHGYTQTQDILAADIIFPPLPLPLGRWPAGSVDQLSLT